MSAVVLTTTDLPVRHMEDAAIERVATELWKVFRVLSPEESSDVPSTTALNIWVLYAGLQREAERRGMEPFWEHL